MQQNIILSESIFEQLKLTRYNKKTNEIFHAASERQASLSTLPDRGSTLVSPILGST